MKTKLLSMRNLLTLVITFMAFNSLNARDWFVKPNASGEGTNWEDAANVSVLGNTLTTGGAFLADGDVVYMAAGKYSRTTTISLTKYVSVTGGYPATSTLTNLPTRNLATDSTLFLAGNGTAKGLNINATTATNGKIVLDGLNFENFTATGSTATAVNISSSQANIEFKNVGFKNNISVNANGGALYMGSFAYNITISFDNCNFISNQANWTSANGYGGAAFFNNGTTAKTINFNNCNFKNNSAYGRGGALYFSSVINCNITDCLFDTNFSSNTTDNLSTGNGGCFYIAGGTSANTFNLLRTIIVNSSNTSNGSVFWFNTTPKNTLNLTDCSLIGNYSSRTSSARAAFDCSSFATTLGGTITRTVMSNYNYSGGKKASNCPDVMNLSGASTDANVVFSNSILNGAYLSSSNALAAVTAPTLYTTNGYLADTTIALALSGDLKITNKIVLKKTFTAANLGTFVHAQIFDVKAKMNLPMTLVANIPTGYKLTVNGTDYAAGEKTMIIAASASDPVITLAVDTATGLQGASNSNLNVFSQGNNMMINGLTVGDAVSIFKLNGQQVESFIASANQTSIPLAKGVYIVKVKTISEMKVSKVIVK